MSKDEETQRYKANAKNRILSTLRCPGSTVGMWKVTGESDGVWGSNNPIMGILEGTLNDCIDYACDMKGFFSYGTGGNLERYKFPHVIKVDEQTKKKRQALQKEKAALEANLKKIENELKSL